MNDTSPNVKLVKRNELPRAIKKDIENSKKIMTPEEIDQLYAKIHKYTHAIVLFSSCPFNLENGRFFY